MPELVPGRLRRALGMAPVYALAVIYTAVAAYAQLPLMLISPIHLLFALAYGLPALYIAELLIALPLHWLLQWRRKDTLPYYIGAGILTSLPATWIWSEVIRIGPIPLFRDFLATLVLTSPAGAVGGAMFWRIANTNTRSGRVYRAKQ